MAVGTWHHGMWNDFGTVAGYGTIHTVHTRRTMAGKKEALPVVKGGGGTVKNDDDAPPA